MLREKSRGEQMGNSSDSDTAHEESSEDWESGSETEKESEGEGKTNIQSSIHVSYIQIAFHIYACMHLTRCTV